MWVNAAFAALINKKIMYEFRVTLVFEGKEIVRVIEMPEYYDLFDLAYNITKAYNFDFDHLFEFHDYIKRNEKHKEVYECACEEFSDRCSTQCVPGSKIIGGDLHDGVENKFHARGTMINKVFKKSKRLEFWFDFGDDWRFEVKCVGIASRKGDGKKYPRVTLRGARAPKQYSMEW